MTSPSPACGPRTRPTRRSPLHRSSTVEVDSVLPADPEAPSRATATIDHPASRTTGDSPTGGLGVRAPSRASRAGRAAPDVDRRAAGLADVDQPVEELGDVHGDPHTAMRGRPQRNGDV